MNDKTYCKWESASTFYFSLWFFPFKRPPFLFFSFFLFSRYTYFFHTYPFNNPVTYFMTKKQIYCILYNVQMFKIYTRIFHLIYFPAFLFSSSFQWSYISVHTRIRPHPCHLVHDKTDGTYYRKSFDDPVAYSKTIVHPGGRPIAN